jgi:hypothetical protein
MRPLSPQAGKRSEPLFAAKEVGKVTGIGLATAYGIAKKNGASFTLPTRRETAGCFLFTCQKWPEGRQRWTWLPRVQG